MRQPYYAVIFSSERTDEDNEYGEMAQQMVELAKQQPSFLGIESARDASGFGIMVSYWDSLEAIQQWKANAAHKVAQERGKKEWYRRFSLRICQVERESFFEA